MGVDQALWVGTPFYSGWLHEALASDAARDGVVREVPSVLPLRAADDQDRERMRVVLLSHHNDPIRKINLDLFVRRPIWLEDPGRQRCRRVNGSHPSSPHCRRSSTPPTPPTRCAGVFRATGHDYRLDLPSVAMEAYRLPRPTPEQWERLMAALQADEAARALQFKLPEVEEIEAAAASAVPAV